MNLIEKSMNFSLGFFMYSREKIEAFVEDLVNKGDISNKDAMQFASDLVKKGEEQRSELKKMIKDEITEVLGIFNAKKHDDYVLKAEINQIIREQVTLILLEQGIINNVNHQ